MLERLVLMQIEDNMVTFERKNGNTIIYPLSKVPSSYKEGDIIKAIVCSENFIIFFGLDANEMKRRQAKILSLKERLRRRARRGTNNL